jgi:hydroxymethylbilane synthase
LSNKIIIGSRGSDLALWQANYVKDKLEQLGQDVDIKVIQTKGDTIQHLSFDKIEGKGFFTKEIENALIQKEIDLAVHSLKDLETSQPKDLCIGAIPKREDAADCLLINKDSKDESKHLSLVINAVVGSSSARRKNQLKLFREDIELKDLRGNVPTRIKKLKSGNYDAIILAKAGLNRLKIDLSDFHVVDLDPSNFISAPGQGALGLQIRSNDLDLKSTVSKLNDSYSESMVNFERDILNKIGGGCHSPFGAYSKFNSEGERISWVSYADEIHNTPIRFVFYGNNINQIIKKIKLLPETKKLWISRSLIKDSIFKKLLESANFKLFNKSLIEKKTITLEKLPECNWIFFNSSFSFDSLMNLKESMHFKKIAAFGKSTAEHIKKQKLNIDFIGNGSPDQVAEKFADIVKSSEIVFFPSSDRSLGTVQNKLQEKNKKIIITYQTNLLAENIGENDYLVFTSPSNVEAYLIANKITHQKVVSIGPSTTKSLKKAGVSNVYESYESTEIALADTVLSLN